MEDNHELYARQDFVDDTIYDMLCELAGREIEWNIGFIAEIRDAVGEILVEELSLMEWEEFYP